MIEEKGTFMWAVEQMKAGKKVKRNIWRSSAYITFISGGELIYDEKEHSITIGRTELTATDWELFGEKKPLSDKFKADGCHSGEITCHTTAKFVDVKQALKEFIEEYTGETLNIAKVQSELYRVAKKHFGKELIE